MKRISVIFISLLLLSTMRINAGIAVDSISAVIDAPPATPPTPTVSSNACGDKTVTRVGNPPSGVIWCWQTTLNSTDASNTSSSFAVTSSRTVYLRAYSTRTDEWGGTASVSVTVTAAPAMPGSPTLNLSECGQATMSFNGSPPSGVTWYWQNTSASGTSTANSTSPYTVVTNTSGLFYINARNSAGCWSESRSFQVTVTPAPAVPPTPTATPAACGPVTLSYSGSPASQIRWRWQTAQNGTSTAAGSTYTATTSGTYYLRSYDLNTQCWSAGASSVTVTVNTYPATPATPTITNNGGCGTATLTRGSAPGGVTWFWQGTNSNGQNSNPANNTNTFTVPAPGGTYYLQARNNTSGCWSTTSSNAVVTVRAVPAQPPAPIRTTNLCGPVQLSFDGTPGSTEKWYWQKDGSESTGGGFTSPYTISNAGQSGTYYLQALHNNGCWGPRSAPITVAYHDAVGIPDATDVSREEPGPVNLSATLSPANGGDIIRWYDLNNNLLATGPTFSPTVTRNTTYKVVAYDEETTCESAFTSASVDVYPKPVIVSSTPVLKPATPAILSVVNNSYSTYNWSKNGVFIGVTTPTLSVTTPGYYAVTVTKTDFSGQGTSNVLELKYGIDLVPLNYVVVNSIKEPNVTTQTQVSALNVDQRNRAINYMGGFGNTIQSIAWQLSPDKKDIVAAVKYDQMGRQPSQYLPYRSSSDDMSVQAKALDEDYLLSDQYKFYHATTNTVEPDEKPYSLTTFEPSPLQRATSNIGVGQHWHENNKKSKIYFGLSDVSENIRIWYVDASGLPVSAATYGDKELSVTVSTDEDDNNVKVYTDKLGRTIVKMQESDDNVWLQTYYVYNALGQLSYVLPPLAIKNMAGFNPDQQYLDTWAFQYRYDDLGRSTEARVPGSGWTYAVYDNLDRPVLTQDAEARKLNRWDFIKYDYMGRPVLSGVKVIAGSTRASVQSSVDAQVNNYEVENSSSVGYTLNRTFPTVSEAELLTVNYFDSYRFLQLAGWDAEGFSYAFQPELGQSDFFTLVNGLSTGSKVRIVTSAQSSEIKWLNAVQYYDNRYRPIQMTSEHHLSGTDRLTNQYDFVQLIKTLHTHSKPPAVTQILQRFEYDHAGRLTQVFSNVNQGPTEQLVAQYEYNALGQLRDKKLHYTQGSFLQSLDYRYNIRGWLRSMNGTDVNAEDNDDADASSEDFFGLNLLYDQTEATLNDQPGEAYFNGNIAAAKWKAPGSRAGDSGQRSYKFGYDKAGRMLHGTSQVKDGTWSKEQGSQNELITYDENGNILSLKRHARQYSATGPLPGYEQQVIDDLQYTYAAGAGNKLTKVEDAQGHAGGFDDKAHTATEITYDDTGGMITDANKGISNTVLNIIGKPYQVTFADGSMLEYTYTAGGEKLRMVRYENNVQKIQTDYAGGAVYNDGALEFIGSPEGRLVKKGNDFEYQYAISDQQGNTRVVFSAAAASEQTTFIDYESDPGQSVRNFPTGGGLSSFELFDHTDFNGTTYSNSQLLNGGNNSQVGIAKSFAIYPGDKISIGAYAKYFNPSGNTSNLTGFAAALLSAFALAPPQPGEIATPSAALNDYGTMVASGGGVGNEGSPKAFVNILIFDKDHNFLDIAFDQLIEGAQTGASKTDHDYLFAEYTAKEVGYAYIYVSNENPTYVETYFDDVSISYTPSRVLQYNEYYPFGLQTSNSWTREGHSNDYLYNGGAELNKATNMYETFFRGYDPTLGRFNQIDPLAGMAGSWSPYHYAKNNPIYFNDPLGDAERPRPDERDPLPAPRSILNPGYRSYGSGSQAPNSWLNNLRGVDGNAAFMSIAQFVSYYGINPSSQNQKSNFAERISGVVPQKLYAAIAMMFNSGQSSVDILNVTNTASVQVDKNGYPIDGTPIGANYFYYTTTQLKDVVNEFSGGAAKMVEKQESPYDGYAVGIGGSLALGGGVNFGLGFVWNKEGDWRFFMSGGPSAGVDASIGLTVKAITNRDSTTPFDPNQYAGWGSSHNIGIGVIDIVPIAGDNRPGHFTGTMGASYFESGGGVSYGLPLAYTYQMSKTFFPGDWIK
jgi:RHS repeat-associated protein